MKILITGPEIPSKDPGKLGDPNGDTHPRHEGGEGKIKKGTKDYRPRSGFTRGVYPPPTCLLLARDTSAPRHFDGPGRARKPSAVPRHLAKALRSRPGPGPCGRQVEFGPPKPKDGFRNLGAKGPK